MNEPTNKPTQKELDELRAAKITAGISVALFGLWLWVDAMLTVLERTGAM